MHFKTPISQYPTLCLVPYVSFESFPLLNKGADAWELGSIPGISLRADAATLKTNHSFHCHLLLEHF